MRSVTYSYARQHLAETMKNACTDHDPIVVSSKNDHSVVGYMQLVRRF